MKQILVQQNEAGQRLDKLLSKILNKAPKSFIYKMLRKKNIVLNGKKADGSEKLVLQDEIKLFLSDDTIEQFSEPVETTEVEQRLSVLYEDQNILIVNKPLGVLSQKAEKDDISMVEYIISYLLSSKQITKEQLSSFKPSICNRLDRNTSGILIAGKSLLGLQEMARLLKDRSLDKYYLCIVRGKVEGKKRIEGYLSKDEDKNLVKIYSKQTEGTDYICTEYEPLKYSKNVMNARIAADKAHEMLQRPNQTIHEKTQKSSHFNNNDLKAQQNNRIHESDDPQGIFTLLQVKLITGKSHQIRAHLSSIGHPLIGDFKYGNQRTNHYFKKNFDLSHQLLHSYRMVFPDMPGELSYLSKKEFKAEVPELFEKISKELFG
ncbi:MAG TPA: RluA family pseudouridine synthase [Mobilitalea sp.]|nr:RluA family pseudouridine synthase [Mobilitalea sp.]